MKKSFLEEIFSEKIRKYDILLSRFLGQYGNMHIEELAKLLLISKYKSNNKPINILEIGTFNGLTAYNLSINNPISTIYTIDIGDNEPLLSIPKIDQKLIEKEFEIGHLHKSQTNVVQIIGDSAVKCKWNPQINIPPIDLMFIDGAHSADYVYSDTQLAFQLCKPNATIVWHNYGDNIYPDVTEYLDFLSNHLELHHIAHTSLVTTR